MARRLSRGLPEATPKPCSDCPWRRNATPGWLGPFDAFEWLNAIHGESAIACHQTITETDEDGVGDWEHPAIRQCRGVAIFRAHVCKSPRNPNIPTGPEDHKHVFSNGEEFVAFHTGEDMSTDDILRRMLGADIAENP